MGDLIKTLYLQIKPDDVLEPELPSKSIIVIECPSEAYLPALAASDKLQGVAGEVDGVALVIHMTPAHVRKSAQYAEWMRK